MPSVCWRASTTGRLVERLEIRLVQQHRVGVLAEHHARAFSSGTGGEGEAQRAEEVHGLSDPRTGRLTNNLREAAVAIRNLLVNDITNLGEHGAQPPIAQPQAATQHDGDVMGASVGV